MKKTYSKPNLKCVRLLAAESLLVASQQQETVEIKGGTATGSAALSNEENHLNLWGNSGNSIWSE